MNLRQKINAARARLVSSGIEDGEAGRDANLLARHVLGFDRATLMTRETDEATTAFVDQYDPLIERRARREPVAYIRGEQEFWSRDFAVNRAVLIPRPETELIIEELLACLPPELPARPTKVADIGTGSGCLAITAAAELPLLHVTATDISSAALDVARANAERHGVSDRVTFAECAYLNRSSGSFDFIMSNPPYVTEAEYENLAPEVREYEPRTALTAGEDGLRDIRQVVDIASTQLVPGGTAFIEIGHQHADAVAELVGQFPSLHLKRISTDLQRIPRVAIIERKITES
ncbi:MAG TPA: peptide chain release factor N(5)-glutamine methyltransferase [Vicinamibacterales bacterium]|nr:peptide chain release factor N(5)-glutamine methyltransferase [Vicinamibacterales bacterium]